MTVVVRRRMLLRNSSLPFPPFTNKLWPRQLKRTRPRVRSDISRPVRLACSGVRDHAARAGEKLGAVGKDHGKVGCCCPGHGVTSSSSQTFHRSGLVVAIGGPLVTMRLMPSEEELRSKYNPELRARAEDPAIRQETAEEFDDFVGKLKDYSKSSKPGESQHVVPVGGVTLY